jgi:hypothetical protein
VRNESMDDEERHEAGRSEALSQYQNELDNRDRKLGEVWQTRGPGSADWKACERKLKIANEDCQSKALALNRATDATHISGLAMGVLFFGLCAFETPVNKFMFDILLALQNWESYIISFVMSFGLLCLAHVAGFQARQIKGDFEDKFYFGKIAVTLLLLAFLFFAVAVLTICRAYASTVASAGTNFNIFTHVIEQVKHLGPWAALLSALQDQGAMMLAAFNLTGIACAFILSFISHDSDTVYQGSLNAENAARETYSRMARKYEKLISRIGKKSSPRLSRYAAAFSSHNSKVLALRRTRNAPPNKFDDFDLSSLDKTLSEARQSIKYRAQYLSQNTDNNHSTSAEDVTPISSISGRDRRA